jgi:hypothetical protein
MMQQRLRRTLRLVITVALMGAASTWAAMPAQACNPGGPDDRLTYADGWYRNASTIPGGTLGDVRATIYELSPYVAAGFDASWVELSNGQSGPPGPNGHLWVQIGWIKFAGGDRHVYDEWTDASGNVSRSIGGAFGVGGFTPYEVYWNAAAQRLQTYAGGVFFGSHIRHFTIRQADNEGEIKTLASQMPGGTNQHEQFINATVANLGGSTYDYSGTVWPTAPYFGNANGGSRREDIWDNRCAT